MPTGAAAASAGGLRGWWEGMWSAHGPAVEQKLKTTVTSLQKAKFTMPGMRFRLLCGWLLLLLVQAEGWRGCRRASWPAAHAPGQACISSRSHALRSISLLSVQWTSRWTS